MANVDRDWIKKQFGKGIAAEESLIRAEKEHRDHMRVPDAAGIYEQIIRDDEKHLDAMKAIAARYGLQNTGPMETVGGLLGGLKSAMESVVAADPFQTVGDDLMLKSNAINYDYVWGEIFNGIGDEASANEMKQAATDDEGHRRLLVNLLSSVGMMEARGQNPQEQKAA